MSDQLVLTFDTPPEPKRRITLKPQAVRVLGALRQCGGTATPWECCRHLGNLIQRGTVSSRFSELRELGYVVEAGSRLGPCGQPETVFKLTARGWRLLQEAA